MHRGLSDEGAEQLIAAVANRSRRLAGLECEQPTTVSSISGQPHDASASQAILAAFHE
jgi:hypothetical protein